MIKKSHICLWITALCVAMLSCQPVVVEEPICTIGFNINLPIGVDTAHSVAIQKISFVFNDLNMGKKHTYSPAVELMEDSTHIVSYVNAPAGYYDVEASIDIVMDSSMVRTRAYLKNVVLSAQTIDTAPPVLAMAAHVVQEGSSDFIFAEIFSAGTQTPQGKNYIGDSYFVLYNNTEHVLYADGVVLLESKLKNSQKFGNLIPYFISDYFGADAIYRIPGNGTEHPVEPGGTILLVDNAQDHRQASPQSFDLRGADFEWYDQSTNASVTDIDNPDVPNLEKVYCYTLTIWLPNRQGNTSFALGRMPAGLTDSAYLADYRCTYDYLLITNAGTFNMSNTCFLFPNEWILDCVNTCPHSAYQWLVTSPALDGGWTYIGEIGSDKARFGKSVRRGESMDNGRRVLQDSNNSTMDFLPAQEANPFYFRN